MILNLDKKTGFKVTNNSAPVVIKDHRGITFYDTRFLKNPVREFNLPKGRYIVKSGFFKEQMVPVNHKKFTLPPAVRDYGLPTDFEIKFGNIPDKARINWKTKTITFDHSFKKRPLPEVFFILFHEYGHAYYGVKPTDDLNTYDRMEKNCDLFAYNMMIDKGYNPSQISLSQIQSLSDLSNDRKHFLLDKYLST